MLVYVDAYQESLYRANTERRQVGGG